MRGCMPLVLATALIASGCGVLDGEEDSKPEATAVPAATPAEVEVTRDSPALPAGCRPSDVATLVGGAYRGFSEGDAGEFASAFATGRDFQWYSMTSGRADPAHFVTRHPRGLPAYVVERHRQREQLRLLMVAVDREPNDESAATISFLGVREADDLAAHRGGRAWVIGGKGEVDCERRRVYVMSTGTYRPYEPGAPLRVALPCAKPNDWDPSGRVVIACARGGTKDQGAADQSVRITPRTGNRSTTFRASVHGRYPLTSGDNYTSSSRGPAERIARAH